LEDFQGEKTLPATPRKRREAREKGQVPKSKEINSSLVLLFALVGMYISVRWMFSSLATLLTRFVGGANNAALTIETVSQTFLEATVIVLKGFAPCLAVIFLIALAASFGQVGFTISFEPLTPKLDRIDPIKGVKKLFSLRGVMNCVMSLGKLSIIGGIAYLLIVGQMDSYAAMVDQTVWQILVGICKAMFQLVFWIALALMLLAVLDYGYQWWQHEKDLKMTRREVMEEMKRSEGDPQVKARVKQIQREMSRRRMLHKVPEADVVVTNPTHYAVALQYVAKKMGAPKVVAKGKNLLAKRIKEIARSNNVPVVENPPLARTLYKTVEVGDDVPASLYRAVAQVMAHIYRLRQMARAQQIT